MAELADITGIPEYDTMCDPHDSIGDKYKTQTEFVKSDYLITKGLKPATRGTARNRRNILKPTTTVPGPRVSAFNQKDSLHVPDSILPKEMFSNRHVSVVDHSHRTQAMPLSSLLVS